MPHGNYVHEIFAEEDIRANKTIAGLAYLIFFLPMVLRPHSAFGRFHANQALLLFVISLGNVFLRMFLSFAPTLGNVVFAIICIVCVVFAILGMLSAFIGKASKLPLIGGLRLLS